MTREDRRIRERRTPERRQNARTQKTVLGCALGLGALIIILLLAWPLEFA